MGDFKYLSIVEWAKNYINENHMREGDRFLSEKELCDIHGVSRQTVRQALMTLENDNILTKRRGSGTFVGSASAPAPAVSQGCMVGVISTYFSDYIFPGIVTGIEKVLRENDIAMQMAITHNRVSDETKALKTMLSQDVKGFIIEPSKSALPNPNMKLYEKIGEMNIPVVFFNAKYPWSDFPCVAIDDEAAGRVATEYLWKTGHRKISGIFTLDDIQGHKRYSGYMQTLISHNSSDAEHDVLWFATNERKTLFETSEKRILKLIYDSTAIVCYNDNIAVSLLNFCRKHGIRVPDDLSIVGIDNSKLSRICEVPLTTVTHPHQLLGEAAAKKLIDAMNGAPLKGNDTLFAPELMIRSSTRPLTR